MTKKIRGAEPIHPGEILLTGTSAEFWMNLQCRYDLWHAQQARVG